MTFAAIGGQTPASEIGWRLRRPRAGAAAASKYSPAYTAASGLTQELAAYWPRMTSADSAALPEMRVSLDRARDLVRNDPHAAAGVMRLADMLVGSGWTCVATPDARALGIDPKAARELGRALRSEWKLFSRDPRKFSDARRRLSLNGQFRLAARTLSTAGEACAVLKYDRKRVEKLGARYATCLAQVDPDRLCNPNNKADCGNLRAGVEFDADGVPIAYHIRNSHPADWQDAFSAQTWTRVERETRWGRPVFIHAFEPEREDQTRAVTPFAALVSRLRMIGKFADTEIASATANALFAAFVKSDLPSDEVAQRLAAGPSSVRGSYVDSLVDYFEANPVTLGGVRVPVLPPNTSVELNGTPRQTASFAAFQTAFLQAVASALGLSYEQLSMDWSRTNYSSARAALNEVWRTIKRLQAVFAEQYVAPIFFAFVEEAFDKGYVQTPAGAPDFWDMPEAYVQARWIGPGRGFIDPTKEAEAADIRMANLTSNLEIECAEAGLDWEENVEQIAFQADVLTENNIDRNILFASKPGSQKAGQKANTVGEKEDVESEERSA